MRKFISIIKEKKKRNIIIGSIIGILVVSLFGVFLFRSLGNDEYEDVTINETIKLSNIDIDKSEGIYTATLSVTKDQNINYIKINFLDSNKKEIVSLIGYVGRDVVVGDEVKIKAATDEDISNFNSITYEKIDSSEK